MHSIPLFIKESLIILEQKELRSINNMGNLLLCTHVCIYDNINIRLYTYSSMYGYREVTSIGIHHAIFLN